MIRARPGAVDDVPVTVHAFVDESARAPLYLLAVAVAEPANVD